jgi:hypothetical protein
MSVITFELTSLHHSDHILTFPRLLLEVIILEYSVYMILRLFNECSLGTVFVIFWMIITAYNALIWLITLHVKILQCLPYSFLYAVFSSCITHEVKACKKVTRSWLYFMQTWKMLKHNWYKYYLEMTSALFQQNYRLTSMLNNI